MKITICTENFIRADISNELIEKAYNAHNLNDCLTDTEYDNLKEIISKICGLPNEDDYEIGKDTGYWACVYAEDDTAIYE